MFRLFALVLTSAFFMQAHALARISGVVCTEDQLPDGNLQQYEVRMVGAKYEIAYRLQKGSMIDEVEPQASEVIVARDLDCTFGSKTNGVANCHQKDAAGNVIGSFSSKLNHETYVSMVVPGKEYSTDFFTISLSSPELKAHIDEDRFPEDANKAGSLYVEFNGHSCQFK